jgi:predicted DNA-binding transcriptional regulator YafY
VTRDGSRCALGGRDNFALGRTVKGMVSVSGMLVETYEPDTSGRVWRLEALKLLLAEREYATAADLAADLGVSLRTVRRDLATLRNLGIPVGGVTGRGGGVHLERGWSLGRVHLNESEAIGLLLSLAIAQRLNSPLLLDDVRSIERKVAQAFSPSQAARIRSLRRRVLVGSSATPTVAVTYHQARASITGPLLRTFTAQQVADINYTDQAGTSSTRTIEIHYLYYSLPVWYALAWDRVRNDARSFRIDRISSVTATTTTFRLRPVERFTAGANIDARPV